MLNISPRSAAIVASFFVIASAVSGCASEENEQKAFSFTDDNGEDVTVSPNGDGTETATYADGRSVTFQRGDDGSMTAVGGTAALLGGLAAGYLLARGFSGGAGYFDSSRGAYRVTTRLFWRSLRRQRHQPLPCKPGRFRSQCRLESGFRDRGEGGNEQFRRKCRDECRFDKDRRRIRRRRGKECGIMKDWIDNLDRKIFPFVEYPGYEARYPAIEGLQILPSEAAELRMMSRKLYKVFQKTCDVARKGGEKFLSDMEIPRKLWPYLSIQNPLGVPTWISRFDFVKDRNLGFRMVELNADTPCAVIEAYYGNGMYCGKQAWLDPNAGEREKLKMFLRKVFHAGFHPTADLSNGRIVAAKPFVFSCFPDYVEDYGTTMYLMNTMKEAVRDESPVVPVDDSIRFASFYDLRVDKDTGDCVIPGGTIAGGLYRLHPLEILVDEESEDGYPIGTRLLDGYADGRFVMMNPPESILMQSKAFQALVWSLYLDGRFYNSDEQRLIKGCLFPTFFTEDDCAEGMTYIEKPIWGREGLGIRVRRDGKTVFKKEVPNEDDVVRRDSKSTVFQQFADQPTERILTDEGRLEGYVTYSCFILGELPSALYARFSPEEVAGTEAYWLPLTY